MRIVRAIGRRLRHITRLVLSPRFRLAAEPLAARLDLAAPSVPNDPFVDYERLRADGSVQFLPRNQGWVVLGYDDVQFVLANPQIFSNAPYAEVDSVLLAADPPAHGAVRRLVSQHFSPSTVAALTAFAAEHARTLLRPTMDGVADYAVNLSDAVAARLLGFDAGALDAIRAARDAELGLMQMTAAIDAVARTSTMHARLVAGGLEAAEACSVVRLLWLAATATSERTISWSIFRLLRHPDLRARLERDLTLVPLFVEEVLRLHPPELVLLRRTTADVVIGEQQIPAGSLLYVCLAAANRDPMRFDSPDSLVLERSGPRHLSFGHGIHHCVGASLGRGEIVAAVGVLLTEAPDFEASADLHSLSCRSGISDHALRTLPLTCVPKRTFDETRRVSQR